MNGQPWPPCLVRLNVYDLADSDVIAGVNNVLLAVGTGAFHAGVEVYYSEWSFGCTPGPNRSGIFCVPPRSCDVHKFRESIVMGETHLSEEEVCALIDGLALQWNADGYDLLRRNCCHFSDELCIQLGVGPVPEWVTSLAGVGAMLRSLPRKALGLGKMFEKDRGRRRASPPRPGPPLESPFQPMGPPGGWMPGGPPHMPPWPEDVCQPHMDPLAALHPHGAPSPRLQGVHLHPEPPVFVDAMPPLPEVALAAGDKVEVWSNSSEVWCPGYVESADIEWVVLAFQTPGAAGIGHKKLPANHDHVRRAGTGGPGPPRDWRQPPRPPQQRQPPPQQQPPAAVQTQLPQPLQVEGGGRAGGGGYPGGAGGGGGKGAAPPEPPRERAETAPALGAAQPARPSACSGASEAGERGTGGFGKGSAVEIYSASRQLWCVGRVELVRDGMVRVAFTVDGTKEVVKELPADHEHLRRPRAGSREGGREAAAAAEPAGAFAVVVGARVEVYSASAQAWCPGHVESVRGGKACLAFRIGDANDELAHKVLPVDHEHLRVVGPAPAAEPGRGEGAPAAVAGGRRGDGEAEQQREEYAVGDAVEVYSLSRKAWFPGVVERTREGFVLVAYAAIEGATEPSRKEIPTRHSHLRRRVGPAAGGRGGAAAAEPPAPPEGAFKVGDSVEVYSASRKAWCPGRIDAITNGVAVTCYKLPGGEFQQKELPLNHEHLRKPLEQEKDALQLGEAVEVLHASTTSWCPGRVVAKGGGNAVRVAYLPPGAGLEEWAEKDVTLGDADVRRAEKE